MIWRSIIATAMSVLMTAVLWALPILVVQNVGFFRRNVPVDRRYSSDGRHYMVIDLIVAKSFSVSSSGGNDSIPDSERSRYGGVTRYSLLEDLKPIPRLFIPPGGYQSEGDWSMGTLTGWPLPSFRMMFAMRPEIKRIDGELQMEDSYDTAATSPVLFGSKIPSEPLYTGLAINFVFWWLIAFGVLSIPLRPWLRRRKGFCPKCAYDLKRDSDAGCPECGWGRDTVSGELSS